MYRDRGSITTLLIKTESSNALGAEALEAALRQSFLPFSEGLQARAFISESGKIVLKLFKTFSESQEQFRAWGKDPAALTKTWHENGFLSCRLAFDRLREKTGLLHLHLDGEPLPIHETVIAGQVYDLQGEQFLLQERTQLVRDKINDLMNLENIEKAYAVIDDVMKYIADLWRMDITEDTFNFDHNYGYTENGKLIQFDVGSFFKGRAQVMNQVEKRLLLCSGSYEWLRKDYPVLATYLERVAARLYQKFKDT